ncbi:hypothetical protein R3P38DRAFT_2805778 [Favolaschia claudopus]|uniref:Uncharacterized protein n=1 Tax=Favolaschia claudopus TaxID=2862362 RepID=A0AAV9ZNF0_9AGAR
MTPPLPPKFSRILPCFVDSHSFPLLPLPDTSSVASQCTSPATTIAIYALTIPPRAGLRRRLSPYSNLFFVVAVIAAPRSGAHNLDYMDAFPASNSRRAAARIASSIWIDVPRAGLSKILSRRQANHVPDLSSSGLDSVLLLWLPTPSRGAIPLTRRIVVRRAALQSFLTSVRFCERAFRVTSITIWIDFPRSPFLRPPSSSTSTSKLDISSSAERHLQLSTREFPSSFPLFFTSFSSPDSKFLRCAAPSHHQLNSKSNFDFSPSAERRFHLPIPYVSVFLTFSVNIAHFIHRPSDFTTQSLCILEYELCLKSDFKLSECSKDSGFSADFKFTSVPRSVDSRDPRLPISVVLRTLKQAGNGLRKGPKFNFFSP